MDRDHLIDLFSEFGPVVLRRMFGGYGIAADGVNFAMALRAGLIFRVDEQTEVRYKAEGAKPFQYEGRNKTIIVKSYRHLPERLYDDPEELAEWAREAVGAAKRAAIGKTVGRKRSGQAMPPAKSRTSPTSKAQNGKPAVARMRTAKKATRGKAAKRPTSNNP